MKLSLFFKKYIFALGLFVLELLLFFVNVKSGTFLVGWDNLYPELNFDASFQRHIFSMWQEYRGLGVLDGMAHAANFPHTIVLWLLHFVIPQNMLRYVFMFLTHFLGGLGIYYLFVGLVRSAQRGLPRAFAFLGSVFYLLNLATVQMFYAPFEQFAVHFAALPWIVLLILNYFKNHSRRNLLTLALVSFLSIPQAHVPTVFIGTLGVVGFVCLFEILKRTKKSLVNALVVLCTLFVTNAPWVLPYTYSAYKNSSVIANAKINLMSSPDIFAKNQVRGGVFDVVTLKGFMFDVNEYKKGEGFAPIMEPWREHVGNFAVGIVLFFLAGISLFGLVKVLLVRERIFYPFVCSFLVAFFFLGNDIPLLSDLNSLIRDSFPLFGEAFRFPFTKFSIVFVFSYTIFFAYGFLRIFDMCSHQQVARRAFPVLVFLLILVSALPAFRGHFFFREIQQNIPQEYFQTIEFFKDQELSSRIATLPQPSFWNWRYYKWGSRGSGFLWQGIRQAMLERPFDPWSNENENYYWELSYAIYSQNPQLLKVVFEKYRVNWILVDKNISHPVNPRALYLEEIDSLLANIKEIKFEKEFGNIAIYRYQSPVRTDKYISVESGLSTVGPSYNWTNLDRAYVDLGDYVSAQTGVAYYYPWRSLFTGRKQEEREFKIDENSDSLIFEREIPENYKMVAQENDLELTYIPENDLSQVENISPSIDVENNKIQVQIPKIGGYISGEIDPTNPKSQFETNCKSTERLEGSCAVSFWLPQLENKRAYLITVSTKNIKGRGLYLWIENLNTKRADIETYLSVTRDFRNSFFVLPPMEEDGVSYSLHFENRSNGGQESINELGQINVYQIPFNLLTSLKLVSPEELVRDGEGVDFKVEHPNPSVYKITLSGFEKPKTLVLAQAYDLGWKAYTIKNFQFSIFNFQLLGEQIQNHVLVNNWANGWVVEPGEAREIVLVYWPQYLQYAGYLILITISLGYLLVKLRFWGLTKQP